MFTTTRRVSSWALAFALLPCASKAADTNWLDVESRIQFRKAAAAFEAERQETPHTPAWGAAEAYLYLGRCYLDRGAILQARDALEQALLLAPESVEARRLLSGITSG